MDHLQLSVMTELFARRRRLFGGLRSRGWLGGSAGRIWLGRAALIPLMVIVGLAGCGREPSAVSHRSAPGVDWAAYHSFDLQPVVVRGQLRVQMRGQTFGMLRRGLRDEMQRKGWRLVQAAAGGGQPDLLMAIMGSSTSEVQIHNNQVDHQLLGQVMVELRDARTMQVLWRGEFERSYPDNAGTWSEQRVQREVALAAQEILGSVPNR